MAVGAAAFTNIPAASKVLLARFTAAQLLDQAPGTLIRTRGLLSVKSDQVVAREDYEGAFGCAFVNETAGALGVTAIPGPSTAGSIFDGWFVYQHFTGMLEFGTAVGFDGRAVNHFPIDSKAMRKFDADESLVIMAENENAGNGCDLAFQARFLIKAG